ncbi:MAG: biopolymer transporter ExbD, partial [Kiritimatiellaceae bacterium]|nr:biopolymer transporter ExbD [Kiritimatiellaceae bacterium]
LIDVVFLLIVYFMVTSSLIKREADISFILPTPEPTPVVNVPVDVLIEIQSDGAVKLEGMRFSTSDRDLDDLIVQISGLKQIAATQESDFYVNILPHQDTLHRRVIDVMDACAKAGVDKLGFSKSI